MKRTSELMQALAIVAFAGVVTTANALPAKALSFTTTAGPFSTVSGSTNITFDSAPSGTILGGGYTEGMATYTKGAIVQGNSPGQYAPPFPDNGTNYLTVGGTEPSAPSPVEIAFTKSLNYFGLLWGSVDTYNSIQFLNDNTLVKTFTGADVIASPNGNQGTNGTTYVNFFAGSGESFNRILLSSSQAAFESDNHAVREIPTPALLPGLIALGVGVLRKRKSEATAEAEA